MLQLYYNEQDANVLQRPTPAFSNLLLLSDHVLWPSGEAETRLYFHMQVFEITSASSLKRRRTRIFTKRQRSYRNDCLFPGNGMLRLPVYALGGLLLLMLPGAVTARMVAREGLMFGHRK
jgi:hypothetical protein